MEIIGSSSLGYAVSGESKDFISASHLIQHLGFFLALSQEMSVFPHQSTHIFYFRPPLWHLPFVDTPTFSPAFFAILLDFFLIFCVSIQAFLQAEGNPANVSWNCNRVLATACEISSGSPAVRSCCKAACHWIWQTLWKAQRTERRKQLRLWKQITPKKTSKKK